MVMMESKRLDLLKFSNYRGNTGLKLLPFVKKKPYVKKNCVRRLILRKIVRLVFLGTLLYIATLREQSIFNVQVIWLDIIL